MKRKTLFDKLTIIERIKLKLYKFKMNRDTRKEEREFQRIYAKEIENINLFEQEDEDSDSAFYSACATIVNSTHWS